MSACKAIQRLALWKNIKEEYQRERWAWCDLEEACEEWYMDSCHLWEDNYLCFLFYAQAPSYDDQVIKGTHEKVVPTNFQYDPSTGVMFLLDPPFYGYMKGIFSMEGLIYLDPRDHGDHYEHRTQLIMCPYLGNIMSTSTRDLDLWMSLLVL
jgi:hypothetical protein